MFSIPKGDNMSQEEPEKTPHKAEEFVYSTKKQKAQTMLRAAISKGLLFRPDTCELCKNECVPEGHHMDYNKPLDATWLCRKCHSQVHGALRKKRNREKKEQISHATIAQKKLIEWMEDRKLSIHAFLLQAKISYANGWNICKGYSRPGLELAIRIEHLTDGFVDASNWLETYSEPEPAHKKKKTNKHTHAKEHKTHGSKDK